VIPRKTEDSEIQNDATFLFPEFHRKPEISSLESYSILLTRRIVNPEGEAFLWGGHRKAQGGF